MEGGARILTPFVKQCFVTTGVTLNLAGHGVSNGFSAILFTQLQKPDSEIPIDDTSGSWVVSVSGIALVAGNFIIPFVMGRYGRRIANMVSLVPMILGWVLTAMATNVTVIIFTRLLHGISMGMATSLGPILIGEYTSPKCRGAFLSVISVMISAGVLVVHTLGSYLHWQTAAVSCAFISLANLVIVLLSPESPSWLADKGRHDESKRVFRWLRGDAEDHELERMIEATGDRGTKMQAKAAASVTKVITEKYEYLMTMMKSKEFYKPVFIMVHMYTLSMWGGVGLLVAYAWDVLHELIGGETDLAMVIITLDAQRVITNMIGVYLIKKNKRRTMLLAVGLLAIVSLLLIALYAYLRKHSLLPFDHPAIGIAVMHLNMLSIGVGTSPICYIIAGELFPLQFRSTAGGVSVLFHSTSYFVITKTYSSLTNALGLHGAYFVYSVLITYCVAVVWWLLPETKDRTLREIEDEFRGVSRAVTDVEMMPSENRL